jgi:hypothetical protein
MTSCAPRRFVASLRCVRERHLAQTLAVALMRRRCGGALGNARPARGSQFIF